MAIFISVFVSKEFAGDAVIAAAETGEVIEYSHEESVMTLSQSNEFASYQERNWKGRVQWQQIRMKYSLEEGWVNTSA